jgi:FkbM family methyltransferase
MVIVQNIIREEWGAFFPPDPVRLIIDAGANIGDTTAWYLSKFRNATVVALEPHPENYAMLQRNCEIYGDRAILLKAALWPTEARLTLHNTGDYTSISLTDNGSVNSADSNGVSVSSILRLVGHRTVDILKCDIEGAEVQVFNNEAHNWLPDTRCIVMELHGESARQQVYSTIRRHAFQSKTFRNTHIFWQQQSAVDGGTDVN